MRNHPMIKFTLIFIAGIVIGANLNIDLEYILVAGFVLTGVTAVLYYKFPDNQLTSIFAFGLVLLMGMINLKIHSLNKIQYPFTQQRYSKSKIVGTIDEVELFAPERFRIRIAADLTELSDGTVQKEYNYLVTIKSKSKKKLRQLYEKLDVGDRIQMKGTLFKAKDRRNPGEFDYNKYLKTEEIHALISVRDPKDVRILTAGNAYFSNIVLNARTSIADRIDELFIPKTAGLLRGLILADRRLISDDVKESFVNSGVIHVLAVSGLHVGLIVFLIYFIFARLNIYLRYGFSILSLFIFVLITGAPTSVVRASFMALLVIVAISSNRNYNSVNTLALAAFFILIFNPNDLFSPGFQLSFSAVLSILVIFPIIENKLKRFELRNKFIRYTVLFIGVSFAAQIGTLPFTLVYFGKLSIIALAANFIVIPVISIILSFGIFSLVISSFAIMAAVPFASGVNAFTELLFLVVNWFAELPAAFVFIRGFSLYDSIVFFLLLSAALFLISKTDKARYIFLLIIFLTANYSVWVRLDDEPLIAENRLSVISIDVGQGDAFLIAFPNGKTALIDAGNAGFGWDNGERVILPLLRQLGVDKLNYAILSHLDSDHYGGIFSLITAGVIDTVIKPATDISSKKEIRFLEFLQSQNVVWRDYSKSKLTVGNTALYFLNPTKNDIYKQFDANNRSCVIKLLYGNCSFMFVGDCGKQSEKLYVRKYGTFLKSNVLKVGHHGSKTSSSINFLNVVDPSTALISCGIQNKFRHPSPEVVSELERRNITVFRTDFSGAILLRSDGKETKLINWKS